MTQPSWSCAHACGEALLEEAELLGDWQRPSFDLATESVCTVDDDQLVAYAEVYRGRRAEGCVRPSERGRGIGAAMLRWTWKVCEARSGTVVGQTVIDGGDAVELFKAHGYTQLWSSWILELPGDREIVPVSLPASVLLRGYRPGEERRIFDVIEDAFNEWPNRDPSRYEDWEESVLRRPDFEPWQLLVAVETGGSGEETVGACYVDGEGWVNTVATRADRRGRGLGRALLSRAFADARARGATQSGLSTDSRTGALDLYLHVGMTITQTFAHFARSLRDDEPVPNG